MALYIIAIGGTGARCVEALAHLSACGVFGEHPIKILFVDPDESNGNLSRTRETLRLYQNCHQFVMSQGRGFAWLRTPLIDLGLWSPFTDTPHRTLSNLFDYNNYRQQNSNLGHLFDVLYTQSERELQLDVGFRGRPAIGAAVMSRLGQEIWQRDPWKGLIDDLKQDAGSGRSPRVFFVGSIFGGTGASGLPTLLRLMAGKLRDLGKRQAVTLGGLLMLPYFQFPEPGTEQDIYARSDEFLLNTKAALRYYMSQQTERDALNFDVTYLLGAPDLAQIDFSSVGRDSQRNNPHFIELLTALAANHFSQNPPHQSVMLLSRQSIDRITWADIPDRQQVKPAMVQTTRFAFAWLTSIFPIFTQASTMKTADLQVLVHWFSEFFRPEQSLIGRVVFGAQQHLPELTDTEQQQAQLIRQWCATYWQWLIDIHQTDSTHIDLFELNALSSLKVEHFSDLVVENRTKEQKERHSMQTLQTNLKANASTGAGGTIGLARCLYSLCAI